MAERPLVRGIAAGAPPDSTNARMSFFVTRPPAPVPVTWPTSTPCSAAIRATTGETNVRSLPPLPAATGAGAAEWRGRPAAGAGGAAASAAGSGSGGVGSSHLCTFRGDHCEPRPDVDRLALLDEDLADDAGAGARHLRVHLVGRDLEQRLVGGDRLTDLLQPLEDRALGHGDAHLGHDDVDDGGGHQAEAAISTRPAL